MNVEVEELVFDECVPGATYVKDFTVWNLSEIPLTISANLTETTEITTSLFEFSVFDTGASGTCNSSFLQSVLIVTVNRHVIPAYSHLRVRVVFRPREVGKNEYLMRLENHDADTSFLVRILTVVTAETRKVNRPHLSS